MKHPPLRIGTAGWSIPTNAAGAFPGDGHHLDRYARVLNCAEINSSFHRSHRVSTYERWAAQTPADFRFSAKLPSSITHERRLQDAREPLQRFLFESAGLGDKLAVLLVQLPPSLAFEPAPARELFDLLRGEFGGAVVCEPRHASWFGEPAEQLLVNAMVGRVAADPARSPNAAHPGGWLGPKGDGQGAVLYHRWHGSPQLYRSRYGADWLQARAEELLRWPIGADRWCIFDNTAAGGAIPDALALREQIEATGRRRS